MEFRIGQIVYHGNKRGIVYFILEKGKTYKRKGYKIFKYDGDEDIGIEFDEYVDGHSGNGFLKGRKDIVGFILEGLSNKVLFLTKCLNKQINIDKLN